MELRPRVLRMLSHDPNMEPTRRGSSRRGLFGCGFVKPSDRLPFVTESCAAGRRFCDTTRARGAKGDRMATLAQPLTDRNPRPDLLSGTPRAGFIDRWIYVFTAASFIVIVLTGFIPDSIAKVAAVQAGQRPPFPLVLHMHAVLMASFLLLLLTQTTLMATGRCEWHRRLGIAAFVLAPAIVVVGFVL